MFYMFFPTESASAEPVENGEVIGYSTGSEFVTTLKDSKRFIKADIIIEIQDKKDEKVLTNYNYRVRDCILNILGDIREEEMKSDNFKDKLKMKIKDALQNMLKIDSIKGIYFNEFVVQ